VRRTGAWVDRLGASAVWISRLQPAWGLSPAVHGRAIVERPAPLVCAACRARHVGHLESSRRPARRARQRLAPTQVVRPSTIVPHGRLRSGERRRLVGVRRCLTRRPAGPVNRRPMVAALPVPRTMARRPRSIAAPSGAVGRGRASPLHEVGRPIPVGDRGITVMRDPPSGRGQAVPNPPARQGRPSPRVVRMTTVRGALPPPGRITARCRAGAQRARQRVAPTRKGAAPAGACGRSPGQPTTPARERQALPDP